VFFWLVLSTRPVVCIENGNDVHGRPWTDSKISMHTAEYDYDCTEIEVKSKRFILSYIIKPSCETVIGYFDLY